MEGLRLDKWLWFARFAKSRSVAQKLIEYGDVTLNRHIVTKPSQTVRPGDELSLDLGRHCIHVRVLALAEQRGPFSEASQLYMTLQPEEPDRRLSQWSSPAHI